MRKRTAESGLAVVLCLVAMSLLMALGASIILASSVELLIAGNFRAASETRAAAGAALEAALAMLPDETEWNGLLSGASRSSFVDGPPGGDRSLSDGSVVNLLRVVSLLNCGRATTCTAGQMTATTLDRPWGVNNPRWQLFAYGPLGSLQPGIVSLDYVVVLVADDQREIDGDPQVDGADPGNPGRGAILLRAESFGPRGRRHAVETVVTQSVNGRRVLSWRAIAQLDPS